MNENEPGGCATLLKAANVSPPSAGRHPAAGILWSDVAAHDEGIDMLFSDLPVDSVMDDQQGIQHGLGEMRLVHNSSHEVVMDGLQVNRDRLAFDASGNVILGQLFEQFGIHQHELRAIDAAVIVAEEIVDHLVGDDEQDFPALIRDDRELGAVIAAGNVSNFNRHEALLGG